MKYRGLIIICISLAILAGNFKAAGSQSSEPDIFAIDEFVQIQMEAANVPGLALGVVHNGEIIHTNGYGRTDPDGTPVTRETPFIIGSVSKGFTALAILQLVEQGKVDLDATVQSYLPWFTLADPQAASQITIRMLLNQTSGLGYNDGTRPLWDKPGEYTLEARIRQMAVLTLDRAPGTEFEYSNYNYMVLGLVVEVVSGQPYGNYVQDHIFTPLKMQNSATSLLGGKLNGLADAYRWWFGFPVMVETAYPDDALPAGFIIASADDMAKYLAFQQAGNTDLLSQDGMNDLHNSCVPSGGGKEYCFGWVHGQFGGVNALFHEGAAQGYYSVIATDPASGWGVVVLSNANQMMNAPVNGIAAGILGYLVKESPMVVSQRFWQMYAVINIVVVLLTALMAWSITRLPHWGEKLAARRPRGFGSWSGRLVLPILAEFIVPFVIWVFLPQGAGFPMWKVMGIFQPDLTAWVFLISSLFILRGCLRGGLAIANLRKKE
jgi:CubicO group peptidase (beta-lactamase class C family)